MTDSKVLNRNEIEAKDKWAIEDIYQTDEDWESELADFDKGLPEYKKYIGILGESSDNLVDFLQYNARMGLICERLYVYANQKLHEDTSVSKYQQYAGQAQNAMIKLMKACAFAEPEILSIEEDTLREYMTHNNGIQEFNKYLNDLIRRKEHILDPAIEQILAQSEKISAAPQDIFSMYNNADVRFDSIHDENGKEVELSNGRYVKFMENKDRKVRKEAFLSLYKTYGNMKNTLAAMYNANLSQADFYASVRNYSSARAMYLSGSNIPESVYDNLIATVHDNIHLMHKYVSLRKKALGVDELHMYDVYAPMVDNVNKYIPFEEAKKIVKAGLAPMGEEYLSKLQEGFDNRWIDVYENKGKRTGAYSWGVYGVHPYVLLNYQGTLDHVFTLAHEMGHALHSYYSDANQTYTNAAYRIFVAEVASTCNESLLIHYLLENCSDNNEKAYLINHFLEQFKGTLYRQTMFAEFEKITHEKAGNGETLTAEELCEIYYNLNVEYFGKDMVVDKEISMEWARIPHFYNPFYVYQYATGMSAAIALSKNIMENGEEGVKDYMKFLTGGGSKDPIDLLKLAGVDMTSPKPIQQALDLFGELLDEMEKLII
ncbi:MAG: oligoendopeptidase F [Eubacterium sp.]